MSEATDRKRVPADLARAGEARYFISWKAAVAGVGGGLLSDFAAAAEAVLTDIFLSTGDGMLEIESEQTEDAFRVRISHPEIEDRRMADLDELLEKLLDGHELTSTRATLVKKLPERRPRG